MHRSEPTSLPGGLVPNHPFDPPKTPGNILIGQAWPEEVRPILEEVLLVYDLLYVQGEPHAGDIRSGSTGSYGNGLVKVFSNRRTQSPVWLLKILEHEIAHAHQHAVVSVDGSGILHQWIHTPEGEAYAEAKQKDLDLGEKMYYDIRPYYAYNLLESAAEHCANYWGEKRGAEPRYRWHPHQREKTLEELAPNRFRWAEEWLTKK